MRRTLAVHIYISIQRGLAIYSGTSRRKSFPGCSVLDRLCAERRLGIMPNAQTRRVTVGSAAIQTGRPVYNVTFGRSTAGRHEQIVLLIHNHTCWVLSSTPHPTVPATCSTTYQLTDIRQEVQPQHEIRKLPRNARMAWIIIIFSPVPVASFANQSCQESTAVQQEIPLELSASCLCRSSVLTRGGHGRKSC